ncbi:MAG TPA: carboxypeptidase-like regulatory domain-containing protein [Bryobacteraceae bacterium]|nr:carboxypeptidase-like regulatory domain-containing protein [Bryobacteraceae bacterium]
MRPKIACTVAVLLVQVVLSGSAGQDEPIQHYPESGESRTAGEGVAGRVTDTFGTPVTDAVVEARSLETPSIAVPEIAILTDANGHYVWTLPPGKYEISISAAGFRRAAKEAVVAARLQTRLDFVLE